MNAAIYSNGAVDTYKGHRDVRAGWAIFDRDTGDLIASGHSLDMHKARNNADAKIRQIVDSGSPFAAYRNPVASARRATRRDTITPKQDAIRAGYASADEHFAAWAKSRDEIISNRLRVEVVEVTAESFA